MFSVKNYHEITPCIRGKELLASILKTSGISKLWLSSDHVFVSTNEGNDLYAFDVVPEFRWRRAVETEPKDCLLNTNQEFIIEVIWNKTEPSFIFVISETGTTSFWEFLKPSHEWIKKKTFQLSNAKGVRIIDVKLHEESGNIVWCERRGSGLEAYCVCCRRILADSRKKRNPELGASQAILHNCPAVDIFCFSNGVCIHPHQPYLEKIFVFWTGKRDVQSVVFKDGKAEELAVCGPDFRDITTSLVGSWAENPEDNSFLYIGITVHPSTQDLLILDHQGSLFKLCLKSNLIKLIPVSSITLPPSLTRTTKEVRVFVNALTFGMIDNDSVVFLFDIVSGKPLQKLECFQRSFRELHVFNSCSSLPAVVFWNKKGCWKLESPPLNELVKTVTSSEQLHHDGAPAEDLATGSTPKVDQFHEESCEKLEQSNKECNVIPDKTWQINKCSKGDLSCKVPGVVDIAVWLAAYGLEHNASVLVLENIISCLGARMEIPEISLHALRTLARKVLQNPTVLFALSDKHLSLQEDSLSELKQFLEELDQGTVPSACITPLNMQVQPFLHELFNTWTKQREVPFAELAKLNKVLGESATGDVNTAVQSVISGISDSISLDKMEILGLQEPDVALKAFVPVTGANCEVKSNTGLGKVSDVLREELKDRRWKRKRSPENAIILGSLFQLLYTDHPEILVDVVELAKKNVADGASKDEATLQDLKECVRDFTLEFLPSVWSKTVCDIKRIKIHADLLVRLGLERDAMDLLLQKRQWQHAVDLFVELSQSTTDVMFTSQLYEMLLAGILHGSGTSERQLIMKIFELKPPIIEIRNLFELCVKHVPTQWTESVLVTDQDSLTIQQARTALREFFSQT